MWGQKTYGVYVKPDEDNPLETAIFVKEGFSPLAFVLTFFWALYNKIWWLVGFCFVFQVAQEFMYEFSVISPNTDFIISMAYHLFIGLQFQDWYGDDLQKRGYALLGVVSDRSLEEAQQRFFDKYIKHATRTNPSGMGTSLAVSQ